MAVKRADIETRLEHEDARVVDLLEARIDAVLSRQWGVGSMTLVIPYSQPLSERGKEELARRYVGTGFKLDFRSEWGRNETDTWVVVSRE